MTPQELREKSMCLREISDYYEHLGYQEWGTPFRHRNIGLNLIYRGAAMVAEADAEQLELDERTA